MPTETIGTTIHEHENEHEPTKTQIVVPQVQPTKTGDIHQRETRHIAPIETKADHILNPNAKSGDESSINNNLGRPSRNLQVDDFDLMKTLGTGMSVRRTKSNVKLTRLLGTFARVWLTRFKNDPRKDNVYALKVLRKADGITP